MLICKANVGFFHSKGNYPLISLSLMAMSYFASSMLTCHRAIFIYFAVKAVTKNMRS